MNPTPSNLLILFTGGTMGMYLDQETGTLSNVPGRFPDLVKSMPECSHPDMPSFDIVEYDPLIDSACMGPEDWAHMAADIEKAYYNYEGFVVIMGTDTMAYAASAMSFITISPEKIKFIS